MLKRRKKLLAKIMVLTMFANVVPTTMTVTASANIVSYLGFSFDTSTGTITQYTGTDATVIIPNTINGVSVKSIGNWAFGGCTSLTNITIPEGITIIDHSVFYGCSALTSINIPASVTSIGQVALNRCDSLMNISVNANNANYKSIDGVLYSKDGTKLIQCPGGKTSITIPDGVTTIGYCAFNGCDRLVSMTVPDSLTTIEKGGLDTTAATTYNVKSEAIKNLLTTNGASSSKIILNSQTSTNQTDFTFDAATGTITKYNGTATSVVIPSTINGVQVKKIGTYAFRSNGITSITIPDGVTSIEDCAFENCGRLTSINIPNSVTSIGTDAFGNCFALTSITIPDSVTVIKDYAFEACKNTIYNVNSERVKQLLIIAHADASKITLSGQTSTVKVTSIALSSTSSSLIVGQTATLATTILPSNAANKGVTWQSSNTAVATVDANGKITAVGTGSATITCTASDGSNVSGTKVITVYSASSVLNSVYISGTEEVGHTLTAKVSYSGTKPDSEYQWQRASTKDGDYTDISDANDSEYKLKTSDKNKYIKVIVSATINGTRYDVKDITSKIDTNSSADDSTVSSSGITIGTSTSSSSGPSASTTSGANTSTSSYSSDSNWNNTGILRPSTATNVSSQGSGNTTSTSNGFIISPAVAFTNPSGHPMTGWVYTSNKWYYLDKDGRAKVGWVFYNGKWYYLDQAGVMVTNTTIDGYTIGSDGAMI